MPTPAPHKQPHQTQWEKVKLGDIAEITAGQSPQSKFYSATQGMPFLQGSKTFGFKYPTIDTYTTHTTKIAKKGSILISVRAPVGDLNFAPFDICIGRGLASIEAKVGTNQSLWYILKFNLANILRQKNLGTTFDSISKETLQKMNIIAPPLPIQENIAQILSTLDKKIELNTRINTELESMAKLLYTRYFVEYNFPDSSGKPYKTSGGAMVYSPTLKREIPQDWEVAKIGDLCDVITGKEDANFATKNGKFAFFTCGSEILRCDIPKFNAKAVLIAGNGNFNIKYFEGAFNAYQRTYILIPKEHLVGLFYMCCKQYCEIFMKHSNGSIVKFITKGDIENIPIPLPKNLDLLNTLNKILSFTNHLWQESQRLAEWRDYLLPLLMGDQVEVV